jgi:hypothetical protein
MLAIIAIILVVGFKLPWWWFVIIATSELLGIIADRIT